MILEIHDATLERLERESMLLVRSRWGEVRTPDGDAVPLVCMYRGAKGVMHVHDIDYEWWSSPEGKQELVARLAFGAEAAAATFVGLSTTMLALTDPDEMAAYVEAGGGPVRGHPNLTALWEAEPGAVREMVMVVSMTAAGARTWHALLVRDDEKPPVLGTWEFRDGAVGNLSDPIVAAMRRREADDAE